MKVPAVFLKGISHINFKTEDDKDKNNDDKENTPQGFTKPTYVPRRHTVAYNCKAKDCNSGYLVERGLEKQMNNDHNADGTLKVQQKQSVYTFRKRTSTFNCQIKDCNSRYLNRLGLNGHMKREY